MTKDDKAAERQRRYRTREQAKARAIFAGATEIEIAWFGTNADGEHVAIDYDGQPIPLVVRDRKAIPEPVETELDDPVVRRSARTKKVYAPKSWDAATWNKIVVQLQDQTPTKSAAIAALEDGKTIDDKQKRQAKAVIEAMPDAPDWYSHLPIAE